MANLHEYVLHRIFDYLTPLEWLQVAQVCKLWKEAVSKQWKKITEINYSDDIEYEIIGHGRPNLPVISAKTAEKMMRHAAPFVKVVTASTNSTFFNSKIWNSRRIYYFGPFEYDVMGSKVDEMLKLLAENATNLKEVVFDYPPEAKLLKFFFDTNKVTKFIFKDYCGFYEDVPTDRIEDLKIHFMDMSMVKSFEGHFINLKTLEFDAAYVTSSILKPFLSKILPHIPGVTSLRFTIGSLEGEPISCKALLGVAKLPKLKVLTFKFDPWFTETRVTSQDIFIKSLVAGCSELQVLKLLNVEISQEGLYTLLTLPRLEILDVCLAGFQSMELPEILNLTELAIKVDYAKINTTNFCKALKKIPKLNVLSIKTIKKEESDYFESFTMQLVCEVAIVAASQEKEIFVKRTNEDYYENIRITKKIMGMQTLNLHIPIHGKNPFIERVQTFVQNNLQGHFVLDR